MPAVNGVGEPCAREPHARFEAAGAGNGATLAMVTAVKRPAGESRGKVAAGPNDRRRHRASPRPYWRCRAGAGREVAAGDLQPRFGRQPTFTNPAFAATS
jgi:hypothetical protein